MLNEHIYIFTLSIRCYTSVAWCSVLWVYLPTNANYFSVYRYRPQS